jgi:flagellar biosynthesis protein FlhA
VADVALTPQAGGARIASTVVLPLALVAMILLMVIPVPPLLLDIFFTFNIVIALAILMASMNTFRPLDFSSFPTVLLFATLLRLALNVASTRVVLAQGHTGTDAAGHVIKAFGEFITSGNFAIGMLVFVILIIINMAVIVKGTGRVSEVSARFTLDAMPGKQMAIDAELNAGLLTAEEAKVRREEVTRESDFYGSMDGATKFVKGDAIAGLLILAINIIGGLIVGMMFHDLTLAKAAKLYITLAIGDGLVAQIPSLLLSLATAIIVTRDSSAHSLSDRLMQQLGDGRAWWAVAGIITAFGLVPGMPGPLFFTAAGLAALVAWRSPKTKNGADAATATGGPGNEDKATDGETGEPSDQLTIEDVSNRSLLMLEVGYGLIPLIEENGKSSLVARITGIRKQASRDLGFIIPSLRIRDNLSLPPNAYRLTIAGVIAAEDQVVPGKLLAIQSEGANIVLPGEIVKDPSFGLDAVWIEPAERARAVAAKYTVVDPSAVIATQVNQLLRQNAADLLGQDDVQELLDHVAKSSPNLVSGIVPKLIPLGMLTQVLKNLVAEQISIADLRRVLESLAGAKSKELEELVETARIALAPIIVQRVCGPRDPLSVITLDPGLEQVILQNARASGRDSGMIEPGLGRKLLESFQDQARALAEKDQTLVVVTSPPLRRDLSVLVRQAAPDALVLSYKEVPETKRINVLAVIGGSEG